MVDVLRDVDGSVNFIEWQTDTGAFEARYVRRVPEYAICYLSSHSGCNKACRFCHLTQTGQTMMTPANASDYARQAELVLDHYRSELPAERLNFNFMARGEPLANPNILYQWKDIWSALENKAAECGIDDTSYNISTIMPHEMLERSLGSVFGDAPVNIYYSLYSMNSRFRKRHLPKAIDPTLALEKLAQWQQEYGANVALHWAFLEGENDDLETLDRVIDAVHKSGLSAKFNLVRYNPYSDHQGREPSEEIIQRNFGIISEALGSPVSRIVPRVGKSCYASCGMFVTP